MVKNLTSAKSTKTNSPNKLTTPLLLLFFLFGFKLFAQIPTGYYDAAAGQSGDQLKASLHNIIKGHTAFPYTSSSTDTWDILKEADRDPNNAANVIGIYSAFSMDGAAEYNSGQGWNREHVWAKSRGDFGTSTGAGTDCHHLRAADISTNSARNNRNFDYGESFYIDQSGAYSGATESKTSSSSYVWEPRDEVKGDVARMIFYMATRYEGGGSEPDLELTETLLDNGDKSPVHARLSVLLEWHQLDPVSDAERSRNDIIYSYQNNRNPYIDHPEYVCLIYSCDGSPANTAPSFISTAVTNITEGETYQYLIETSDAEGDAINITATTLPAWLTFTDNGDGTALLSGVSSSVEVGTHDVLLSASDGEFSSTQSFTITVATVDTGSGSDTATDLFISEYIEGSSYNKGLEIANFTGAAVDLSNYSLFKQTNGSGEWSSELSLSGTLSDGDVYVIVHTSADASMQAVADLITGVGALTFNGNDPVALFKAGSLIDVVGDFNNTADFAKDVTLVRKELITSPNTVYTLSEWNELAADTFDDLGSHTITLGSGETDTEAPSVPTGVTATDITASGFLISWNASTDNVGVVNYTVYLDGVDVATIGSTSFNFNALEASTNYSVNVVSNDAAGNSSSLSSTITVTTSNAADNEAPTTPQNVQVSNVTSNSFSITWDASTDNVGVSAYQVLLDGDEVASTTDANYSFTSLMPATTYLVNIVAEDAAGNISDLSTTISVTTANSTDTEAPSQVTGLVPSTVSPTGFIVTWDNATDNVGVTAYDVYLDGIQLASVTNNSYEFTGLEEQTAYTVYVIAEDIAGNESVKSDNLVVTTSAAPDTEAPTAPADLNAINITQTTLDLNWTASTDNVAVTEYEVMINGTLYTSTTGASIAVSDLTASTNYTFTIFALDAAGNRSVQSESLTVTTAAIPDNEAPSIPTELSATSIGTNSISVEWNASTDNIAVLEYQVYLDGIEIGTTKDLAFTILGLSANKAYQVGISASDEAGNTSGISGITVTTLDDQVTGPQLISESYFELGWDDWVSGGNNANYYNGSYSYEGSSSIRIIDDRGEASSMTSIPLDVNSFNQIAFEFYFYSNSMDYGDEFEVAYFDGQNWNTIGSFAEGIDFSDRNFYVATIFVDRGFYNFPLSSQFRIQGFADNKRDQLYFDQITITGLSSDSAIRQTSQGLLTTIKKVGGEVTIASTFSVFPNPSFDGFIQLQKEYGIETEVSLRLLDARGNVLYNHKEQVSEGYFNPVINVEGLKSGVYFIQFTDQTGFQEIKKILIR